MGQSFSRIRAGWITLCGLMQMVCAGSAHANAAQYSAQPAAATGRCALLVHGIYNSAKSMQWIRKLLESRGWQVYAISLRPNDGSIPFEAMAGQIDAFVRTSIPAGQKFDIVAFSMGGIASRYYIQKMGGYERVRRFVTLGAPNHGTVWAWLSGRSGVKEMRPGSTLLRELNGDVTKLAPLGYTSIYTPFDLSIMPAASSRMPAARNVLVWVPLHPFMVMMPAPLHEVERALE